MNRKLKPHPGRKVRFNSHLYSHWGIVASTIGNDDLYQIISVSKIKRKICKQDFSEVRGQRRYEFTSVEDAWESCQRAELSVGKDWQYRLATNNCEHFVEQITTGIKQSSQAQGAGCGAFIGVAIALNQANRPGVLKTALIIGGCATLGVILVNLLPPPQSETKAAA